LFCGPESVCQLIPDLLGDRLRSYFSQAAKRWWFTAPKTINWMNTVYFVGGVFLFP